MPRWFIVGCFRPWHRNGQAPKVHVIIDANAPCDEAEGCAVTLCGHRYSLNSVMDFKRGSAADVTCIPCRRKL